MSERCPKCGEESYAEITALRAENAKLREQMESLRRERDENAKLVPADGIWVVRDGRNCAMKVGELSDEPVADILGNLGKYVDAATRGITTLEGDTKMRTIHETEFGEEWVRPSNFDLALAALREVAAEAARRKA